MTQEAELAQGPSGGLFGRFLVYSAGILGILWLVGYLPTLRLAGEQGVIAMVAGGLLSLAGSLAGTLPFVWFRSHAPTELVPKILGGIALRLSVVISLALAAALSGLFAHAPLLIWVAISHAGLLAADTFYARRQFSGRSGKVALASF